MELEVGDMLAALVAVTRSRLVLETGTFDGYSTSRIAHAIQCNGGGGIVTIDPNPRAKVWRGTQLEGSIRYVQKMSQDALAEVDEFRRGNRFDMLFLDSDHSYETIISELIMFEPLLREGGVIVLHDSIYYDSVGAAVLQLQGNRRFECLTLETPRRHKSRTARSPGLTIVRKGSDDGPPIVYEEAYRGTETGDHMDPPLLFRH